MLEQADWKDDTDDDELEDQELEAHYMYMAQLHEVSQDAADSGPIFDDEPLREIDQNDDDNDLAKERELLASLIAKLKCEIDESKNRNKFLETSNKVLTEKLKGEIKDFKNKNKSFESSNNFFKEVNNKLSETNNLLYADYKKSEAKLARRNSTEYASQMELECAKVRGYKWKPKSGKENVNPNVSMPLGNASRTANVMDTMTSRRSTVSNTPLSSNSFIARRDCPIHRMTKLHLFLDMEIWKSTCYIRDLKGNDLLTGSRGTDLYSITLQDTNCPNPVCLMAKVSSSQAWLWHRRLSYLNFDTINLLSKNDIVVGLPKLKFVKDHLCSSCELGKAKRKSFTLNLPQAQKDGYNFYTWTYVVPYGIPCEGARVFSDRWSPDELVYGAPLEGPYQTILPSPDDIISFTREDRKGGSQLQPPITKTKSAQIESRAKKRSNYKSQQDTSVRRSYALSWKPCQGDSFNLPDHRYKVDVAASFQRSQIHNHMLKLKLSKSIIQQQDR
uniref:Retrovirus-related Pol polyprotein from transposon TNT 1-94 n=1 Tax=Tanacetum cinerariifolium TaxID=118510 RepID=A0A6L2JPE9_TANCI|nr:retrovirus-related Pol polyprotein from transposon TNT 1-94 [Tanacetum cinerariifolium]